VNVSPQWFRDAPLTIASDIAAVLERTGLPPELLILEINERTVMDDPELVARELHAIRRLGVTLALDDFGAGHTSLTHLRWLPISILKLDHDLVHAAAERTEDLRILRAITTLAQILRMAVVAEGVEDSGQADVLEQAGCDAGQGFLFSASLSVDAAAELITRRAAFASASP
jgi:EAL domain-containing protein (putative c-di-GMP-specific phosphodiesterase class I)